MINPRPAESTQVDNRIHGSAAGAVVQAGSIRYVSIGESAPSTPAARPAQLPPDVSYFTGRAEELATLDTLLDADAATSSGSYAVVISA
ncbi:MAG: hypothetical protein J2P17_20050, partial [Mycobacterium sp.]|nr:hypothetical protein [Mycobacterium sp.]